MAVPIIVANPRRRRRRLPARGKGGRFLKRVKSFLGGRRKRKASRKRRRAHHAAPVAVKANPRRRRRRVHHHHAHHAAPRRRYAVRRNPLFRRSSRKSIRRAGLLGHLAKLGVGAFLGVVVARVIGNLWRQYVSSYVQGNDQTVTWRLWLDDVLRLVAMELGVVVAHKVAQKVKLGGDVVAHGIIAGGTGEVVRQAIGGAVGRLSPSTDLSTYGLNGPGDADGGRNYIDASGTVFSLGPDGQYHAIGAMDEQDNFYTIEQLERLEAGAA